MAFPIAAASISVTFRTGGLLVASAENSEASKLRRRIKALQSARYPQTAGFLSVSPAANRRQQIQHCISSSKSSISSATTLSFLSPLPGVAVASPPLTQGVFLQPARRSRLLETRRWKNQPCVRSLGRDGRTKNRELWTLLPAFPDAEAQKPPPPVSRASLGKLVLQHR